MELAGAEVADGLLPAGQHQFLEGSAQPCRLRASGAAALLLHGLAGREKQGLYLGVVGEHRGDEEQARLGVLEGGLVGLVQGGVLLAQIPVQRLFGEIVAGGQEQYVHQQDDGADQQEDA